jgi:D-hexose-6-phosphate mutarotase
MESPTVQDLNANYAIEGHVSFAADTGGLPMAVIENPLATAHIALNGANVMHFQPRGQSSILFLSQQAIFKPGKAIRGGIPICWPWFGPHPTDPTKPQHGFARTSLWRVLGSAANGDGSTEVRLGLAGSEATHALWDHAFALELIVTAGRALSVTLAARNTGESAFSCTAALHTYVVIGDVNMVRLLGLDGVAYVDKADGDQVKTQRGDVTITAETDRVYLDTTGPVTIDDPSLGRRIVVSKTGSRSTVVWNPWIERARALSDFGDDEYMRMMCVETANAVNDVVTIQPGGVHRLACQIALE